MLWLAWLPTGIIASCLDVCVHPILYTSLSGAERMCRPTFVETSKGPLLRILDGRHPCILDMHGCGDFIPNDVVIEGEKRCLLVTGPNMGGKSTLMRQTGLLVVLAHLVSCVCLTSTCDSCVSE